MSVQQLAFHLTDRCNLNCKHCLRDPELKPKDIPYELLVDVLDQARTVYKTEHVALTGGEPTLHPQFAEILEAIVRRRLTWHVVTNGSRVPRLLRLLQEDPALQRSCRAVDLSLDGADESTHDGLRGAGSWREVMAAIVACQAAEVPFVLQMTVHARNRDQIEAFGLLAAQLGAERASLSWMQPTGTYMDERLAIPPEDWPGLVDRIRRLASTVQVPVGIPEGWPTDNRFHVCEPFRSGTLHVDVEGRLNLCCQHSGIPASGERTDVLADLAEVPLHEAHGRMLELINVFQQEKITLLGEGKFDDVIDSSACNYCLRYFGKPHWTTEGVGGPEAERERWRGAWSRYSDEDAPRRRWLKVVSR